MGSKDSRARILELMDDLIRMNDTFMYDTRLSQDVRQSIKDRVTDYWWPILDQKYLFVMEKKIINEIERINNFIGNTSVIEESSLSRVWLHSENFDVATITAFRGEYTKAENLERNKELKAVLIKKGYGVIKIKGSYIEGFGTPQAVERGENSFFVVNRNNDEDFKRIIVELGKHYSQESVLYKPKDSKDAFLIGTKENSYPGLDIELNLGQFKGGKEYEFMSRVGGRPFAFNETYESFGMGGKQAINIISKKVLDEINKTK